MRSMRRRAWIFTIGPAATTTRAHSRRFSFMKTVHLRRARYSFLGTAEPTGVGLQVTRSLDTFSLLLRMLRFQDGSRRSEREGTMEAATARRNPTIAEASRGPGLI